MTARRNTEIERKFLVDPSRWKPGAHVIMKIRQGYLSREPERVVRVRAVIEIDLQGEASLFGFLTVKGRAIGLSRPEYEYPVAHAEAEEMLKTLCLQPLIDKTRYIETVGEHEWTIDVYGAAIGVPTVAEIELGSETEQFERPSWLGEEVTNDPRFFNSNIGSMPVESDAAAA